MKTITDKALRTLKTKRDAFDAGYNAGCEDGLFTRNKLMTKDVTKPTTKWQCVGPRFNVAGVQYSDYQLIAGGLKPGTVCQLIGEPNNPFDQRAVRIEYNGIKLGYVPKDIAAGFGTISLQNYMWTLHKSGYKMITIITAFNKQNPTWNMITVQAMVTTMCPKKIVLANDIKF